MNSEEVKNLLANIGFEFDEDDQLTDTPTQRLMFGSLQRLIAGAILDWVDEPRTDETVNEVEEWAQEWMIG